MVDLNRTAPSGGVMVAWPLALVLVLPPALSDGCCHSTVFPESGVPPVSTTVTTTGPLTVMLAEVQPGTVQLPAAPLSNSLPPMNTMNRSDACGTDSTATPFALVLIQPPVAPAVVCHDTVRFG